MIGESPRPECLAHLAPSRESRSLRQDRLSQDARDLLAWAFIQRLSASDEIPVPMTAAEVRIGPDDATGICQGGDGFRRHGGSDSLRYFTHAADPAWALVLAHDCDGDAARGLAVLRRFAVEPSEAGGGE